MFLSTKSVIIIVLAGAGAMAHYVSPDSVLNRLRYGDQPRYEQRCGCQEPQYQPPCGCQQQTPQQPQVAPETQRYVPPRDVPDKSPSHPTRLAAQELSSSVLHIIGNSRSGSGVVIGHHYVLTAAHVIDSSVMRVDSDYGYQYAQVAKIDHRRDLALLYVPGYLPNTISLANSYQDGEQSLVVGYPYNQYRVNQGELDGPYHWHGAHDIATTAQVNPGASGGGLFVYENGYRLVGIIQYKVWGHCLPLFRCTHGAAVSLSEIRDFLGQ